MFLLTRPSPDQIHRFLGECKNESLSYREVGASRRFIAIPPGSRYVLDHHRFLLGSGRSTFDRASAALRNWRMFQLGWVEMLNPETAPEVGAIAAVLVRHCGFFSLNAARVVYTIDAEDSGRLTSGFAYGTLHEHAECGEERFSVEWNSEDDTVHYDLLAFSRPAHRLVRIGYPIARMLQKRFAQDSGKAMIRATKEGDAESLVN